MRTRYHRRCRPPAEAPRPEGFVLHSEEEEPLRVARVSLQVLEQTARELVEEDWI